MDSAGMGTTSVNAPEVGDRGAGIGAVDPAGVTDPVDPHSAGTEGDGPRHPVRGPLLGAGDHIEHFSRRVTVALGVAVALVLAFSLVLRFWTTSDLWLDEALTVNIAKLPLHDLPSYLKRDGAPPLFYVLLHFWMGIFGSSDLAVRSLSGVMGVITVPLAWLAGRRLGGRVLGFSAMLLVATSPFAVRYATETRMYALVALLTVLGYLALDRALRQPRAGNLIAVAVVTGLLLYSQYWSLYLIATTLVWLAYQSWRGRAVWRRNARVVFVAVVVGCLTFLPWIKIFLYQSKHTGTPWAAPANFAAMVNAISSFAGGPTSQGRLLTLILFALSGLGLFGMAVNRRHVDIDIRTRPLGRPLAIVVVGTLALAIVGGFVSNSAFDARYASVVFIPIILLVALGLTTFLDLRVRAVILTVAVAAGLFGAVPNITTNRTQAGKVAAALALRAKPGDVIAYCPDQLGPAVNRLLPAGRYQQITFPRGTGPTYVNWVDYAAASRKGSPVLFAQQLERMAGTDHQIFVAWFGGYQTFGTKCEQILQTLGYDKGLQSSSLLTGRPAQYYQPMGLVQYAPTTP
ncbi:MAG TPA: glycosyltransferase family 39 protein [Acidimicrobiales bacterium]|nr:glycosyltransferase family 39 protein [Acidimicrobiales bacterium]